MFCFLLCCFVSTFKRWRGEAKESSRKRITKENEKRKKNRRHRTQWTRVEWKKERIRGDRGGENHGATRKPDGAISLSFFLFSLARRFIIFFVSFCLRKRKRRGPPDDGCRRFQALTYIPSACKLLPSSSLCSASFGGPNSVYFKPPPLKKSALT